MTYPVVIHRPMLDRSFWTELPDDERRATIAEGARRFVSFDEIVEACERSDDLIVIEDFLEDITIVGLNSPDTAGMPGLLDPLEEFEREHSDRWAIVPKEGSLIEYVEDQLCVSRSIMFPRLVGLERDREEDVSGLLFAIVRALGLRSASYDFDSCVATYS